MRGFPTNFRRIRTLFDSSKIRNKQCNFKDNREPPNQACGVYKLSCNDCDEVYIGETGRLLKERTEEHREDVY